MGFHLRAICLTDDTAEIAVEKGNEHDFKKSLIQKVTWLVMISYTLLMFKPVMPVIIDVLAHTFWEQQHMLVVHEVNGKFHLHNELVNASHQSDKHSQNGKAETQEYMPVAAKQFLLPATKLTYRTINYLIFSCYYPFPAIDIALLPPRSIV